MTREEIHELAKEAGFKIENQAAEIFAKLVAAKERELCAKLIDEEALDAHHFDDSLGRVTEGYARMIRARADNGIKKNT